MALPLDPRINGMKCTSPFVWPASTSLGDNLISLENELPIGGPVGSLSYTDPYLPHRWQVTLADQSRHWLENLNPELSGSWMLLRLNPSQVTTESFPVRPL